MFELKISNECRQISYRIGLLHLVHSITAFLSYKCAHVSVDDCSISLKLNDGFKRLVGLKGDK